MIDRDLTGRVAGVILFVSFLGFQGRQLWVRWPGSSPAARLNGALILVTVSLFLAAYFFRRRAIQPARGFKETIFALFIAALPAMIHYNPGILEAIGAGRPGYEAVRGWVGRPVGILSGAREVASGLMLVGNSITLCGMLFLGASFSILPEARAPVFRGIYAWVRHPLYLGEMVAVVGILLSSWSILNVLLTAVFAWGQWVRAGMEEEKLARAFPEYEAYRQRTGRFFPRLRRQG